jgi:ATPase subunit of ABC transporter with duplicated ATPase domains
MMALLYDVDVRTINYHLKKVFSDSELTEDSVIRNFRITAADGKSYDTRHYNLAATDREILQDAGKVTAEIARAHAMSEFEKYRIAQDRLFESDFDRAVKLLEVVHSSKDKTRGKKGRRMTVRLQNKKILIIAGPNGAGKTTFARSFLPDEAACPMPNDHDVGFLRGQGLETQAEQGETQALFQTGPHDSPSLLITLTTV